MNILVIYPYIPYPLDRGTYQRTFHLLKELAREHTVDLIALSENGERLDQLPVFEEFCRQVRFVPFQHPKWSSLLPGRLLDMTPSTIRHWELPQLAGAIREQLSANAYDLVHVCDIVLAQYFLNEHKDIPLSIDRSRVDLQFQLQQTAFNPSTWKDKVLAWENMAKLWIYEKRVASRCQMQVVCGPDDKVFVRRYISPTVPVTVIANGVDLDFFKPEDPGERAAQPTLLFCGAMDYTPNVDAVRWYFSSMHEQILQRIPDLQVLIVGRSPLPEIVNYGLQKGVTVTGGVEDVRPYYRKAWLQMIPLRIGGGTRLKIVESLAMGTPAVSTTIGAQGLKLTHGSNVLLADTAEAFVEQVVRAMQSSPLRQYLRQAGIQMAREQFGWRTIGSHLIKEYDRFSRVQEKRIRIMDVPFDVVTMPQTVERIGSMIESGRPHHVATANVDFLVKAGHDAELRGILNKAHLVVCDGKPLVWLSRLLGRALPERVAGSDLVPLLLKEAEQKGWSVYFLGGEKKVLRAALSNVSEKHARIHIAGSYSPPFSPLDEMDHEGICKRIREARPDLLLVSLGCPKQEKWIARNYASAGVPVCIGVGATVDFLAGTMRRAPRWMQLAGLEWVFRMVQEPRRLFKRYATDLVLFGIGAVRELSQTFQPQTGLRQA